MSEPSRSEHSGVPNARAGAFVHGRAGAFAPGRVNLIGEHTDYNQGLALPFAVAEGVTVRAEATEAGFASEARVYVHARALDEHDEFALADPPRAEGWRAFVRGTVSELRAAGLPLVGARVEIGGTLEQGSGLSSSAALEVALCLALARLGSTATDRDMEGLNGDAARARVRARDAIGERTDPAGGVPLDRIEIARLCARVENEWAGAQTGLLDQLASLYGEANMALLIDFHTLQVEPVPLRLKGWRLVSLDSGERHVNRSSGYNERRAECARACQLIGVESLRQVDAAAVAQLPPPLRSRVRHVLEENERVRTAVAALRADDLPELGALLNASHESLRDLYDVSTPAVEATVERLVRAGAAGARVIGGGFGGSVLGLFAPDVSPPEGARNVRPSPGAHLVDPPVPDR
ncbi:MAG TPA: galactokinase family protein [Solirubrobacteraceae bacterium]|jgi:galactokinase